MKKNLIVPAAAVVLGLSCLALYLFWTSNCPQGVWACAPAWAGR